MSNINSIIIDIGMEMLTHPKRIVKFYLCKSSMVPPSSKILPPFSHEMFRLQVVIAKYEACSCCSGGAVVCSAADCADLSQFGCDHPGGPGTLATTAIFTNAIEINIKPNGQ